MPVYVGLRKWLIKQKVKDADHVTCSLEKPSYAKTFTDKFVALTGIAAEKLFVKVVSATHEAWLKPVFFLTLMVTDAGWASTGYLPWSLGHFYFCVSGELILIGVHADNLEGFSYSTKINTLSKLRPDGLNSALGTKHNFVIKMVPGDLVCLPANVLVHQQALEETSFLRWAFLDGSSHVEVKKALSCSLSVASSYPALAKDAFASWMAFLQEKAASG
jgi:hypothetical protein